MADEKARYWLKLDKDFLKSPHIKVIKAMPNGKDYVLFYLSLMLESIESVGHLKFTELIPYNDEMLSALTDTNIDVVRSAVKVFESLGLMQILDDGTIFMTQVAEMTGRRSESADRVKAFREREKSKALLVTNCNDNIQSTEYRVQSTEYKEQDTEYNEQDTEYNEQFMPENKAETGTKAKNVFEAKTKTESYFDAFWKAYPKKKSRADAEKAWKKINPNEDLLHTMLDAIQKQKQCNDWTKDKGQFIPYPATWINGKRWEDEIQEDAQSKSNSAYPVYEEREDSL